MFTRPGPRPVCKDSELITMAIVGQCRGWDVETELVRQWHERRDVFPHAATSHDAPQSVKSRTRAAIGERVPWYELPEEVKRG